MIQMCLNKETWVMSDQIIISAFSMASVYLPLITIFITHELTPGNRICLSSIWLRKLQYTLALLSFLWFHSERMVHFFSDYSTVYFHKSHN